jgi:hypothetical protein
VHHVVVAAVAQQVPEHARAERERRRDPAPALLGVELEARPGGDHAHPVEVRIDPPLPLPQRHVGHVVALGRQAPSDVAVPALGAADRVRVEAVVEQADAHGGAGG